jgi:hypothetical protein
LFLSGNFQEFFIGLLSLVAIKRDAIAYTTLLKDLNKATTDANSASSKSAGHPVKGLPRPRINLGNFYSRTRAVEDSPTFSLQKDSATVVEEDAGKPHVALVKLSMQNCSTIGYYSIGQTLSQLLWLGICALVLVSRTGTAAQRSACPVELADLECLDYRADNDVFDRAAERSGAHK